MDDENKEVLNRIDILEKEVWDLEKEVKQEFDIIIDKLLEKWGEDFTISIVPCCCCGGLSVWHRELFCANFGPERQEEAKRQWEEKKKEKGVRLYE